MMFVSNEYPRIRTKYGAMAFYRYICLIGKQTYQFMQQAMLVCCDILQKMSVDCKCLETTFFTLLGLWVFGDIYFSCRMI